MNSREVMRAIRPALRPNFCVVRNVSYGLLAWEADLVVCSSSGYLTEFEIKVSAADWKKDADKEKFKAFEDTSYPPFFMDSWELVKNFYYAAPIELARRWPEFKIPEWAGVIGVNKGSYANEYLKVAKDRKPHRKLTVEERLQLARLGSMRAWDNFYSEDSK